MAPGWRVAGLVAWCVVGCGDDGSGPLGVATGATTSDAASSSVGGGGSSSSQFEPGGVSPCDDGSCAADEACVDDRCRPISDLDACEAAGVSVCGDGILQAPESCDGGPECDGCTRPVEVRPWGDAVRADALDVAVDGAVAVSSAVDGQTRLYLLGSAGATEAVVRFDVALAQPRWVGRDLLVFGRDDAALVLSIGPAGEERWRRSWPDTVFSSGEAAEDEAALVLGGHLQPVHSVSTRGLVVALGTDGEARFEALQGDMRSVGTVAPVGEDVVVSGAYLDDENRVVVRRLGPDGTSRWTDAGFWWTAAPVAIWAQGTGTWAISGDGTAVLHDADGHRVRTVPCLGSVNGRAARGAVGAELALAFGLRGADGTRPWWVLAGSPTERPRAWWSADVVGAMAWTPRGSLLVALEGEPRLIEVAL